MITKDELVKGQKKTYLKILANGSFGAGKTYFAMTFPKWAYAMLEPAGIQTALTNQNLLSNMVCYETFVPSIDEDIKETFKRFADYLKLCREKAMNGEIETFILDNLSHLSEYRWMYMEKHEQVFSNSGKIDTLKMYGNLTRWLFKFILTEVLTLPCHIIIPVHIMEETEEIDGTRKKTGKIVTDTLGSFRNTAGGLFNASIFIEIERKGTNQYVRKARCMPSPTKEAKNNIGLPELVENLSYQSIMEAINNNKVKAA